MAADVSVVFLAILFNRAVGIGSNPVLLGSTEYRGLRNDLARTPCPEALCSALLRSTTSFRDRMFGSICVFCAFCGSPKNYKNTNCKCSEIEKHWYHYLQPVNLGMCNQLLTSLKKLHEALVSLSSSLYTRQTVTESSRNVPC